MYIVIFAVVELYLLSEIMYSLLNYLYNNLVTISEIRVGSKVNFFNLVVSIYSYQNLKTNTMFFVSDYYI